MLAGGSPLEDRCESSSIESPTSVHSGIESTCRVNVDLSCFIGVITTEGDVLEICLELFFRLDEV